MELRATEVRPTISLSSSPPTPPPDGQGFQVSSELDKTANANFIRAAKSHLNSARLIQARTEKLAQISVDGLNQKCHLTAADINRSLLHLGKKSLDDNVTVRTVTVITLIFLPTQLIAVSFWPCASEKLGMLISTLSDRHYLVPTSCASMTTKATYKSAQTCGSSSRWPPH